jgi:hypothetical protein
MTAVLQADGVTSCSVASSAFGATTLTADGTYYSCGSITLPTSGLWRITFQARTGGNTLSAYIHCAISTSTSISNQIGTKRMLVERVAASSSNLNIGQNAEWYIDVADGASGATIYVLAGYQGSVGSAFMQDDQNGQTGVFATKVRESTTGGTNVTNAGF